MLADILPRAQLNSRFVLLDLFGRAFTSEARLAA